MRFLVVVLFVVLCSCSENKKGVKEQVKQRNEIENDEIISPCLFYGTDFITYLKTIYITDGTTALSPFLISDNLSEAELEQNLIYTEFEIKGRLKSCKEVGYSKWLLSFEELHNATLIVKRYTVILEKKGEFRWKIVTK